MSVYLGLMSGTSLDGIDAVAVLWPDDDAPAMQVFAHVHRPFEPSLRERLQALNQPQPGELEHAAAAALAVSHAYADAIDVLLPQAKLQRVDVRAVGAHGQTVRHRPHAAEGGFTIQLLNGALLAERCGIDVVCDLRSRDLAAGGQGAPLVPAFHADRFGVAGRARAVLNLGGIANVTLLRADGGVGGFDTGPANVLLDAWAAEQLGTLYDDQGQWAASGEVDAPLLERLLAEPYFLRPPPKSTGRDLFRLSWLKAHLAALGRPVAAADVQATLAELTAFSVADALQRHLPDARELWVCGGGALNRHLLDRLATQLAGWQVRTTDALGLPPQQVEAVAFAWLAREFAARRAGNRPDVTGARGPRILGCLYPA
ncbi:MAG TPA: anhydro-N-acetylmuramic acid kinase [Burkholderiaceae bacterium]|nr:anhydro-N-acetylmuramic acid kinase [Burkholderiaceae bacterium]